MTCWRLSSGDGLNPGRSVQDHLTELWESEWARRQGIIERLCEMVWEASDPEYRDRLELIYPSTLSGEWMPVVASRLR